MYICKNINIMSCKKCKEKKIKDIFKNTDNNPKITILFSIVWLLFSIYGMKAKNDNIGHVAHFGGAIGGFVITLVKFPFLITEEPKTVMALLVPIVILFIMAKMKKI